MTSRNLRTRTVDARSFRVAVHDALAAGFSPTDAIGKALGRTTDLYTQIARGKSGGGGSGGSGKFNEAKHPRGEGGQFTAEARNSRGRLLSTHKGHASREAAVSAARKAHPDAHTISSFSGKGDDPQHHYNDSGKNVAMGYDRRILFKGAMKDARAAGMPTSDAIAKAVKSLRVHRGDGLQSLGGGVPNRVQRTTSFASGRQRQANVGSTGDEENRDPSGRFASGGGTTYAKNPAGKAAKQEAGKQQQTRNVSIARGQAAHKEEAQQQSRRRAQLFHNKQSRDGFFDPDKHQRGAGGQFTAQANQHADLAKRHQAARSSMVGTSRHGSPAYHAHMEAGALHSAAAQHYNSGNAAKAQASATKAGAIEKQHGLKV